MTENYGFHAENSALAKDVEKVGNDFRLATLEAANNLGGEKLEVDASNALIDGKWFDEELLDRLELIQPGVTNSIVDRATEIQNERHAFELREQKRPRSIFKTVLLGFKSLN